MIVALENATQRWNVEPLPCSTTSAAWNGPEPAHAEPTKGPRGTSAIADSGVTCYEQDWLIAIYNRSPELANTPGAGDDFTGGMAQAA